MSAVRVTLRELPDTLDETYERILINVPKQYVKEAQCALQFLAVSLRPLTIDQVAEAVAVDVENEIFDSGNRLRDKRDILEICSSLVILSG